MKKLALVALVIATTYLDYEPATAQQSKKPLYTAPFGIAPYTFRRSFPNGVAETLDTIKMMGFTEIEGGGGRGIDPATYRKMCEKRGISIPSMGSGYERLVKDPQAVADKAKILGAKYVMTAWIPHENGSFNIENAKQAVEDFNAVGKVLKKNGIIFCYHVHGYEFWPHENGTLLDYIINNTNPKYVSLEMDVFWVQFGGGDPVELLEKYGDRWKLMHLKDMRKGAKKVGIAHYFIEDESDSPTTNVPQSIAYLKSLQE